MSSETYWLINFAPGILIIILMIFLVFNKNISKRSKNVLVILLCLEIIEMIAYSLELYTAELEYFNYARIVFSIICYTIRTIFLYLFLLLLARNAHNKLILWLLSIPCLFKLCRLFNSIIFSNCLFLQRK